MRSSWHLAAVSLTSAREQLAASDAFVIMATRISRCEQRVPAPQRQTRDAAGLGVTRDRTRWPAYAHLMFMSVFVCAG